MHFHQRELESDDAEHVADYTPRPGFKFRGLREGDVVTIDGVAKTIVAKRVERFDIICVFDDGTEMDRLDIHRMIDSGAATMREDENFIYLGLF